MDDAARARLEGWKLSLLDLSSDNRLLDARDGKTIIALPEVDPVRIAFALASGSSLAIDASDSTGLDPGRLRVALSADELGHRLTAIRRTAKAQAADCGVHALWLGLGLLHYSTQEVEGATIERVAPLALWPIELPDEEHRLISAGEGELRLNHTLAAVLEHQLELVLPEGHDLAALLAAAEAIALTRPGWRVERATVLGSFSFANLTMWSDATAELLARPLVEKLAGRGAFAALPVGYAPEAIAPLDADHAQLAAVAAAGAGASLVVQGPPGTGKSQTIANLIVHAATLGKSVLFVSEKAAALEVVRERLAAVGLGELCLPLGGGREALHAALSRVLDRTFRPGTGPHGQDARLAELRLALDGFATAFHKVGPFGRSVHEALGRLVELRTSPRAELAEQDAIALDRATFDRRKVLVEQLAAAAIPVEPVATHPWRSSTLERSAGGARSSAEGPSGSLEKWVVDQRAAAEAALREAQAAVTEVAAVSSEAIGLVPGALARTAKQLEALGALGALAAASPRPGAELLTQLRPVRGDELGERVALIRARGTGTIEVPRDPAAFLAVAQRHRGLVREVEDRFTSAVAELDAPAAWAQLRKWTGSVAPLRFVALRATREAVRAAAMPGELASDDAMIVALEAVIAERACRAALLAAAEPAARWFGELGGDPLALELDKIDAAVTWAGELRRAFDALEIVGTEAVRAAAWRALVAQVSAVPGDAVELPPVFARLAEAVARWQRALDGLARDTGIPRAQLAAGADHLSALRDQLETLVAALDGLSDWVTFHGARRAALAGGLGPAVPAIERGDLGAAELAAAWERATLLAWADAELAEQPALADFHGASHHAHVAAFADLDRGALALARSRALVRLAERMPRSLANPDPELAALLAELKTPTLAPRALLASIPTLLPRIAPCLLASPFDVAQLLDPALRFDLVVIDEASLLSVAHALGSLARADSAVIVGDAHQLEAGDSVLAAALAAGMPQLELGTHYRSKHEDLIARSNARYYANKLTVFPAAQPSPDLGISWRKVDAATEAETVVGDALARLRDPAQRGRSIAIVMFSRAQQELVEDLRDAAALVLEPGQEPILVKHVDAVQGDERDVVLVVLGNGELADARRLNVATTRAREQMVLYSTIAPADATGELAELLAFAAAGGGAARNADEQPASPVTAAIARTLVERGWIVRHRVGCGAYRLDLAVVDPNDADRYVLAIEHDGTAYASAAAARDRDRLRAQVLGQLGWRLHRVWSFDWWADPDREIQRAHGAIVAALAASRQRRAPVAPAKPIRKVARGSAPIAAPAALVDPQTAQTAKVMVMLAGETTLAAGSGPAAITDTPTAPVKIAKGAIAIGPYMAAAIPAGRRAPDDMFAPRHASELGKVIEQVLAAEAPMHLDRLARRVGAYFGIGRLSQRVTDQVKGALVGRGRYGEEQGIVWRNDQDPASIPSVRVAGAGAEAKRDIDEVPLAELAAAARIVVERASVTGATELVRDVARLLGIARITDKVTERVARGVRIAAQRELIKIDDGKATLPPT